MSTPIRTSLALAALAWAAAVAPAQAQQLVVNGGFETGSLSGWTQVGNTGFADVSAGVQHSGSFGALFGPIGAPGGIMQSLATTTGTSYNVSFWLQNSADTPNSFGWTLNGVTQTPALVDSAGFGYTRFAGSFVAASPSTQLAFMFRNDPGYWFLDDVSVTAVPEPGAWLLGLAGLAGIALQRRRMRT